MDNSRIKNTSRNMISGLANRLISLLFPFVIRTIIIYYMGVEYAGLGNLFTSILQVLNIADLGFNTAVVYSLYKPFAEKDYTTISNMISLIRKVYYIVGTIILIAGLCVLPFVKFLINGAYPAEVNIYVLFVLYLINSVLSYFLFAYKESLLIADQRSDIATNIRIACNVIRYLGQLIVIVVTKNFYIYVLVSIGSTCLTNIFIQLQSRKKYPFIQIKKTTIKFNEDQKKQIFGLFISKLSNTFRNSFDSIIVSAFLGLTLTGIYGNYFYIMNSIFYVMLEVCNSMSASVGNSLLTENKEKNYMDLKKFNYMFSWISGWSTICLLVLYQPFMKMWVGEELLLSELNMMLFCIYYYSLNLCIIRNQYINGSGIWWKMKITYIVEAITNLSLNIILCRFCGITGILISTIITILLFNYIWRNNILFKEIFEKKQLTTFYLSQLLYSVIFTLVAIITYTVCRYISLTGVIGLLVKALVCVVLPNIIFFIIYRMLPEYKEAKSFIKSIIKLLKKKKEE